MQMAEAERLLMQSDLDLLLGSRSLFGPFGGHAKVMRPVFDLRLRFAYDQIFTYSFPRASLDILWLFVG